jgi:mono/diheme cytochrome c family protein
MRKHAASIALALACCLLVAGCGRPSRGSGGAAGDAGTSAEALAEARLLVADRCVLCHGPSGRGDGPRAPLLSPPPRDLGDPAWQRSVTDEQIRRIVVGGGREVGKSEAMPGYPDLVARPELSGGLVSVVRGLERR